jgi:hypothetical protein
MGRAANEVQTDFVVHFVGSNPTWSYFYLEAIKYEGKTILSNPR